jgi:hypothetical protein
MGVRTGTTGGGLLPERESGGGGGRFAGSGGAGNAFSDINFRSSAIEALPPPREMQKRCQQGGDPQTDWLKIEVANPLNHKSSLSNALTGSTNARSGRVY